MRIMDRLRRGSRALDGSAATFNREYATGRWDLLDSLPEAGRYSVIATYCAHARARSVLDVGCGSGVLAERLLRPPVERYVGIDSSDVGIQRALRRPVAASAFEVADARTYEPAQPFDAIIFNEVFCYLEQPGETVARLARFLTDGGVIIASMHKKPYNQWVWASVLPRTRTLDEVTIQHANGEAWDLKLLTPASSPI